MLIMPWEHEEVVCVYLCEWCDCWLVREHKIFLVHSAGALASVTVWLWQEVIPWLLSAQFSQNILNAEEERV